MPPRDYRRWLLSGVGVILNLVCWLLAYFAFPRQAPLAVLHYSLGIGIDFVGAGVQIMVLPAIGLAILIGNTLLGLVLGRVSWRSEFIVWSVIPLSQVILIGALLLLREVNF